jgi:hypothetical protein
MPGHWWYRVEACFIFRSRKHFRSRHPIQYAGLSVQLRYVKSLPLQTSFYCPTFLHDRNPDPRKMHRLRWRGVDCLVYLALGYMGYVIFTRTLRTSKIQRCSKVPNYSSKLWRTLWTIAYMDRWFSGAAAWNSWLGCLYSLANTYAYMASLGILCIQSEFAECPRQLGSLSIYSIKRA